MIEADIKTVLAHAPTVLYRGTILGAPRTKKNHSRVVRAGRFTKVLPSLAHEEWIKSALPQIRDGKTIDIPVNCRAVFYRQTLVGDLVGYMQALADLLEKAGVIVNDSQIVSWDGTRMSKDKFHPRIEVMLEEF